MIDIVQWQDGKDFGMLSTQVMKAGNILQIQVGSLEYEKTLGIDLRYFLTDSVNFQNESFKAYLIEILTNSSINVKTIIETIDTLSSVFNINISAEESTTALVR